MSFSTAGFTVQDQRPSLGDEVQPEVGADRGFPERGLQREVELVDGLEERKVCAPSTTLQSRLFPSCYFFGQQQSQEVPIRPTFLLGPISDLFVNPTRMRQVEAPEVNLELPLGEFQALHRVLRPTGLPTGGTGRVLALPASAGWLRISGMKRVRFFGT